MLVITPIINYVLVFTALMHGVVFTPLNANVIVSEPQVIEYAQNYLTTYRNLVQAIAPPTYRNQFNAYSSNRVLIKISTILGVALEFHAASSDSYQVITVDKSIEQSVFKDEDLEIYNVKADKFTVLIYSGQPDSPMFRIDAKGCKLSKFSVITNKGYFLELSENGQVLTNDISVDRGIYHYPILINGSNQASYWTKQNAIDDATHYFWADLYDAFPNNIRESFLKENLSLFTAYPELSSLANKIVEKEYSGVYSKSPYDFLEYSQDWKEFIDTANKYDVGEEIAKKMYEYYDKQKEIESNKIKWWQYLLYILGAVGSIVGIVSGVKRWRSKAKKGTKSQKSQKMIKKEKKKQGTKKKRNADETNSKGNTISL